LTVSTTILFTLWFLQTKTKVCPKRQHGRNAEQKINLLGTGKSWGWFGYWKHQYFYAEWSQIINITAANRSMQ